MLNTGHGIGLKDAMNFIIIIDYKKEEKKNSIENGIPNPIDDAIESSNHSPNSDHLKKKKE